jgi:signal transduction histidine kinase
MTSARIRRSIYIIFGVLLVLLISSVLFSAFTIDRVEENMDIQVHTRTVIIALKDNLTLLLKAETEERGFIITGDSSYLKSHFTEIEKINATTSQIKRLVADNPDQLKNIDTLENLINIKLSRISSLISLKKLADEQSIKGELVKDDWKSTMERIQLINGRMQENEVKLFKERISNTKKSISNAGNIINIEGALSLLVILFLTVTIISELKKRAIAEKLIVETNIALERKNREIEQFAYVASHDLQEPLRSITNFAKLLLVKVQKLNDSEVNEYANFINRATGRMSNLIFDLLQYSRIGKDMQQSTIDCNALVAEVIKDLKATITETGSQIHVGNLPVITGYHYLGSLFQNLLSNAIKFAKAGERPTIHISAVDSENEFVFSVRDNGIGIEEIYYEKVFIIFQRLHGRGDYPGTGIGLSQCKKIVELHGGKIWVDSEPGNGSTFSFTIPKK